MKRAMLPVFLILTMLCCSALGRFSEVDHWVSIEYDFATGENVNNKRYKDGKKELTRGSHEGIPDLYKRYGLSHSEPLLVFLHDMGFDKNGKQVASASGGGIVDDYFFRMLKQFDDLPAEEVKAIFAHSVALHKAEKYKEITAYQRKEYLRYSAPRLREQVNAFLKAPMMSSHRFWHLGSWFTEAAEYYLIEYRDEFPEMLPYPFYQYVLDYKDYIPEGLLEFCSAEYRKYPTAMNAFLVAYINTCEQAEDWLNKGNYWQFWLCTDSPKGLLKEYHEAGILGTFLQTVMPDGLPPVTREALPDSKDDFADKFWDSLSELPYRNAFLLWIANAQTLKSHFRKQFEVSYQERMSQD